MTRRDWCEVAGTVAFLVGFAFLVAVAWIATS